MNDTKTWFGPATVPMNVLTLRRRGETFMFVFDDQSLGEVIIEAESYRQNPDLSFDDVDARAISAGIVELINHG